MARREFNGTTLEYTDEGRGEPVVFVHGSASDLRTWALHRVEFAGRHRVITYSRRYHWPNPPIAAGADYSMGEHLDDLQAVVETLADQPVHLVGHSYGALLALHLAARAPRLVRSLVLTEPPALRLFVSNLPRAGELLPLLVARPTTALAIVEFGVTGLLPARAAARRGDVEAAMFLFGRAVLGRMTLERLSPERKEQVRANAIGAEFLGSGLLPLRPGVVRQVRTPALLVSGDRSPRLFGLLLDALATLLPHAERLVVAGASHLVHEDRPVAFRDAALAFLADRGAKRAGDWAA